MVFNLALANNTLLLLLFLNYWLSVIAQLFKHTAELVIPIGIPINDAKADIETNPVITETKIIDCSVWFKAVQSLDLGFL